MNANGTTVNPRTKWALFRNFQNDGLPLPYEVNVQHDNVIQLRFDSLSDANVWASAFDLVTNDIRERTASAAVSWFGGPWHEFWFDIWVREPLSVLDEPATEDTERTLTVEAASIAADPADRAEIQAVAEHLHSTVVIPLTYGGREDPETGEALPADVEGLSLGHRGDAELVTASLAVKTDEAAS